MAGLEVTVGKPKTPWHLWVIGIVLVLWNSGGCYDYLMTVTNNQAYLSVMTPEQQAYYASIPTWFTALFAVSVWGGLLGSLLLLLRMRVALPVYLVALATYLISCVYTFGFSDAAQIMGTAGTVFSVVILLIALFEVWYARLMTRRGVLR